MPFRASFDCLWCGRPYATRGPDELEGWAHLCPDCLGRAGDNAFLRLRLRQALADRSAAARGVARSVAGERSADPGDAAVEHRPAAATAADEEDWLLRRGSFAHGPIHDAAWAAELDAAGSWLDALPIAGRIVQPAPGCGWWAPLLATRGELTVLGTDPATLERTRERLAAHGLRAHLHDQDPWSTAEEAAADVVVVAFRLGVGNDELAARLAALHARLRPGGLLATIDPQPEPRSAATDGSPGPAGGIIPADLEAALRSAGFHGVEVTTTGRFFVLARATA